MRTLYLDTEFNSFGGDLISLALVGDDGREFYAVTHLAQAPHPWVAANVLPHLDAEPVRREMLQVGLHAFLMQYAPRVRVVADWPEDFGHFFALLALPNGVRPKINVEAVLADAPRECVPERPHNALSDARALREAWS